jgi:soluble lytic murein transglycosylase-like protein
MPISFLNELMSSYSGKTAPSVNPSSSGKVTLAPGSSSVIGYKDPAWDSAEQNASSKTGVPVELIRSIRVNGEKSNSDQVSPKGARGVYQFIPSTRNAFKEKYGVDAYSNDPNEQALAAAHHLNEGYQRTGSWGKAAAGFNGGISGERGTNKTQENKDYVKRVMGGITQRTSLNDDDYSDAWSNDKFASTDDTDQTA